MVRKTKEGAQETREDILKAAAQIFMEKGVTKATLEEIAEEAGVTRGAVYWHFKNKQDLFCALHDKLHKPLTESILRDLETDHPDPLQQLLDLCVHTLIQIEEDPVKRQILTIFKLKCEYTGETASVLDSQVELKEKSFSLFEKYFERAQRKGHISEEVTPKSLTRGLTCYLGGIVHDYLLHPEIFNISEEAEPLMKVFFLGVYKR
ncbi:TetR family transcriptional regulator [Paremcibacter congregatus]|uniref:TetR family transcriptional regulator n=1 Tax=Paremcibacter congregatus TaxID=2043170 RepID=UPI0030EC0E2B|tara:strand:+ start:3164 stop:3781 length:618 start_codon:yes stop_codon:yes gene_type:complete